MSVSEEVRIQTMNKLPRHLDSRPKTIRMKHADAIEPFGIKDVFKVNYDTAFGNLTQGPCYIELNHVTFTCEQSVYAALMAMITTGFSKDQELASACCNLFTSLLKSQDIVNDTLDSTTLKKWLSSYYTNSYEEKELVQGIRLCAFPEESVVLYWQSIAQSGDGAYEKAIEIGSEYIKDHHISSNEELDDILKASYSAIKSDKEFMKLVSKIATKPLIAMMALTYSDHPDIFEVVDGSTKNGFMQ